MSVRSLREYIDAYGIAKEMPFVEKSDLINTILSADITDHNEEVSQVLLMCMLTGGYSGRVHLGLETGTSAIREVQPLVSVHILAPLHNPQPPLPTQPPIQALMVPLERLIPFPTRRPLRRDNQPQPLTRLSPHDPRLRHTHDRPSSIHHLKQGLQQSKR